MTTKSIAHLTAEEIDEACITIERAVEAATDADNYWEGRVRNAFSKAGLDVQSLEREPYHAVWTVSLNVGEDDFPADKKFASKQFRKSLAKAGLQIRPDVLTVFEQRRGWSQPVSSSTRSYRQSTLWESEVASEPVALAFQFFHGAAAGPTSAAP